MRRIAFVVASTLLIWATPAFAGPGGGDFDGDGVLDNFDNCSIKINPAQDDTDGDDCGNLCDADYSQNGIIGFEDFGQYSIAFGQLGHPLQQHVEPITPDRQVGFGDFGLLAVTFGVAPPGPSGTTSGTTACP